MQREYIVDVKFSVVVFAENEEQAKSEALTLLSEDIEMCESDFEITDLSV